MHLQKTGIQQALIKMTVPQKITEKIKHDKTDYVWDKVRYTLEWKGRADRMSVE